MCQDRFIQTCQRLGILVRSEYHTAEDFLHLAWGFFVVVGAFLVLFLGLFFFKLEGFKRVLVCLLML